MNFSTASKIASVIDNMKSAAILRASNRAKIDDLYNGVAPYSAKEEQENKILININWKTGTNVLHQARSQYENAFLKPGNFFKVTLPDAPAEHQSQWSSSITRNINAPMKTSPAYYQTLESMFAGLCLHGVGARIWWEEDQWKPSFVGVQDILIPTDTYLDMSNLQYFAVRRKITPGWLFRRTFGRDPKNVDPGWKKDIIRSLLNTYKDLNTNPHNYDWANNPEDMSELYKQNLSYYDGDSAPVIWAWDFFYLEETSKGCGWKRKILLDKDSVPSELNDDKGEPVRVLYDSRRIYARKLEHFIHFQFGDGNNVPPFKYHSIRSLGWLLFDVVHMYNRLQCQFTQHVFEQMLTMYRVQDPADRSRLDAVSITPTKGIIPDGLSIVTANERYAIDANLVANLTAQYRQNIGEASSAYTQQVDTGTQKERTKFEVEAILAQISALMGSMLIRAYRQEHFAAREIARRFCLHRTMDFDIVRFRAKCLQDGVPASWLDVDRWEIEPEQVLGSGNKMLEMAQARELRGMRPDLDPDSQMEVDRIYITALTDNPRMANRLVPDGRKQVNDAIHDAELAFGTLMQGVPVSVKSGLNHFDQIETLLRLMAGVVSRITKTDNMGTPQDITGLQTVAQYIAAHIEVVAQNENNKQRVKRYTDALTKAMNLIRAFAQRQQQAMAKQNGNGGETGSAEAMAKVQATVLQARTKAQIDEAKAAQKIQHAERKFEQSQRIKQAQAQSDMQLQAGKTVGELQIESMRAAAEPKPESTPEE